MRKSRGKHEDDVKLRAAYDTTVRIPDLLHDSTRTKVSGRCILPPPPRPQPVDTDDSTVVYKIERAPSPVVPVAVLIALSGATQGEVHSILDPETVIGRAADCAIRLTESHVSRRHLKIAHQDGSFALARLSRNSISVNGADVEGHANLEDGDVIETVGHRFSFRTTFRGGAGRGRPFGRSG